MSNETIRLAGDDYTPASIRELKEQIARGALDGSEIHTTGFVPAPILDSWARCASMGLRPEHSPLDRQRKTRSRMQEVDKAVLAASRAFFRAIEHETETDASFFLINADGDVLRSTKNSFEQANELSNLSCINEDTCGTFAHTIGRYPEKVSVVIGEEHFLGCFNSIASVAAPVLGNDGNVAAYLLAVRKLTAKYLPAEKDRLIFLQSLLITNARNISQLVGLAQIGAANKTLKSLFIGSLSLIKEGCAIIDADGFVTETNRRARLILGIEEGADEKPSIQEVLLHEPQLARIILNGQTTSRFSASVCTPQGPKPCTISVRPIRNTASKGFQGCIVTLSEASPSDGRSHNMAKYSFDSIIGKSDELERAKNHARIFAPTNARILLKGNTGSGKEHFAKAIHNFRDPAAPFISFNCTTATRGNLEELLFGLEDRGRFIRGKVEQANGGTLFLRNIEDSPLELQGYLVSLIDEMCVTPVNSLERHDVSFKLITSTKADLKMCVEKNTFRDDLYYRIASSIIRIPSLAERHEDIIELAEHFCKVFCTSNSLPPVAISQDAIVALESYNWPGNIRQLRTCINYACDVCQNLVITPADLPSDILESLEISPESGRIDQFSPMKDIERRRIEQALRRTNNNVTEAAKILGIGRSTLYGRIKEYRKQDSGDA